MKKIGSLLWGLSLSALCLVPVQARDYSDVSALDWNAAYINYVSDSALMDGNGGEFSPESPSDRGTIALALARLSGAGLDLPVPVDYVDVEAESPYVQGIAWCLEEGVMSGYSDDYFAVADSLNREQFAAALYAFAQNQGVDVSGAEDVLGQYGDAWSVSSWAKDALNWVVSAGLMSGYEGNLNPHGDMSRGDLAVMLTAYDYFRQGKNHLEELNFEVDWDDLTPSEQRSQWIVINTPTEFATGVELGQQIADLARCFEGYPYVENQSSTDGFDCAGLAMYLYGIFGIELEHSPIKQYYAGVPVEKEDLQAGDLLIFGSISHVGIYLGDGYFIHASTPTNGVIISHLSMSYYVQTYYAARRLV